MLVNPYVWSSTRFKLRIIKCMPNWTTVCLLWGEQRVVHSRAIRTTSWIQPNSPCLTVNVLLPQCKLATIPFSWISQIFQLEGAKISEDRVRCVSELHRKCKRKFSVRTAKRLNAFCFCCRTIYLPLQVCSMYVCYAECGRRAIIEQLQKWMRIIAAKIKIVHERPDMTQQVMLDGISLFCPVKWL